MALAVPSNQISQVFDWLQASYNIKVDVEWLEACISWLKQQNSNLMMISQIQQQVYEQWLLSDLSESGVSCLPQQIASIKKTNIPDFLPLQVNFVVNITESAYKQLKKLKGENVPESNTKQEAWQPKANRMLMLDMTDGVQTVKGMEYKPIKELHCNLIPGTKVLINRGVLCRMGVIFLTENNIKILGGQVGDLIEKNSQINVLKRCIGEEEGTEQVAAENGRQNATDGNEQNAERNVPDATVLNQEMDINDELEAILNDDSFDELLAETDFG